MSKKQKEKSSVSQDELDSKKEHAEKRYLVSTFFVALLILEFRVYQPKRNQRFAMERTLTSYSVSPESAQRLE
ncbi:MAG: hypothetical protein WAV53_13075 [Anaerolineae bacterium]